MSSLGVGGATAFASKNNHSTALNHNHRETASKDVAACQQKAKCKQCGVMAVCGKACPCCKRTCTPPKVRPNYNTKVLSAAEMRKKEEEEKAGAAAAADTSSH